MPDTLGQLIQAHHQRIVSGYVTLMQASSEHYAATPAAEIAHNVERSLELVTTLSGSPDDEEARQYIRNLCEQRVPRGFRLGEVTKAIFLLRDVLLPLIREQIPDVQREHLAEDQLHLALHRLAALWADGFYELQEEILNRKDQSLRALSTPVTKVWDGILALPIFGDVDDRRSRQITEDLLYAIIRTQSQVVLLDITGIGSINTSVIAQLMRTVRCAELLGAACWVVGISPEVANTIVTLGIDLRHIVTHATLQQGLDHAFRHLGLEVAPRA
ncbi:MAG: STAS domain-containing protein [Armatimonadetes bacterium]|nr:STAS domain-containing protein [Armatimonadota bacterium]